MAATEVADVGSGRPVVTVPARGVAIIVTSAASSQTGAAVGAHAFGTIGPAGVVAVRQLMAATVLLIAVRPPLHRLTRAQWWPVILLGLVFATMNVTLYSAVDRIGLGLAVTLEFLGPLTVALAGTRRLLDVGVAFVAAAGVYVLVLPGASTDFVGVGLALVAAICWASYILLNRLVGRRLPGLHGTAAASAVSGSLYVPVAVWLVLGGSLDRESLLFAMGAGVLASVVPFALDLMALRIVPSAVFGVLMSIHPVMAALAGWIGLHQSLSLHEVAGIAIIVGANVTAVVTSRRVPRPDAGATSDVPWDA